MEQQAHELLQKMQQFTNTAVQKLQAGDTTTSSFYFSLAASIASQLSELVKSK